MLVNNAGIALVTKMENVSEKEWDRVMDVNVKGAFLLIQTMIGSMIKKGYGRIINISSMAGVMGSENAGVHYCTSKAALIGLTKYLSKSYIKNGITTNAVAPGPVKTEMVNGLGEDIVIKMIRNMPQGKLAEPEDIASIVAFLASDEASFITGAVIEASGGQLIV